VNSLQLNSGSSKQKYLYKLTMLPCSMSLSNAEELFNTHQDKSHCCRQ